jgi:hypothetical protein
VSKLLRVADSIGRFISDWKEIGIREISEGNCRTEGKIPER